MTEMVLTTFDWVPEAPRGFVRDLRVRWALEEAGLAYRVESVPFRTRTDAQYAPQPFKQVPWLADGGITIFESGAILLHIAEKSAVLMPWDEKGRSAVIQWMFAAVNSVETAVLPTLIFKFAKDDGQTPGRAALEKFLSDRLDHMEKYLTGRTWPPPAAPMWRAPRRGPRSKRRLPTSWRISPPPTDGRHIVTFFNRQGALR